jgi:hypothetical protein
MFEWELFGGLSSVAVVVDVQDLMDPADMVSGYFRDRQQ